MKMSLTYRWIVIALGVATALVAVSIETSAQSHQGFLYGKVTMEDKSYTGPIRWGNEEVLWTDVFNAEKASNRYQKMVPEQKDSESWFNYDWNFNSIWEDKLVSHRFTCQFGNIAEIVPNNTGSRAKIRFKNGGEVIVNGDGYNDMSPKIQVIDDELGVISVDWDRVTKVEFMTAPSKIESVFGAPLFGTVEGMRKEKVTGYIVWDDDERLSGDKLDGDEGSRDVSLRFSDIRSITKSGRGSEVELKTGKSYYLTNSNDVNSGNRGVIVVTPGVGVTKFGWDAFKRVTFTDPSVNPLSFDDFAKPKALSGKVSRLDGDDVKGQIVYDVDETLDLEVLEGEENDIEYIIPMINIKRIVPKNEDYSAVFLKNGTELLLGNSQDVSERNKGVLVFQKGKKEPEYVRWREITEIIFD